MGLILAALAVVNLISFCLMGWDKRLARLGKWRVRERTLFLWAACFGALGGLLGMRVFRHKTKHARFVIGFPVMLLVQGVILAFLLAQGI
jgi:uncharacterized membrane protein YsdA (DUF1294 family)